MTSQTGRLGAAALALALSAVLAPAEVFAEARADGAGEMPAMGGDKKKADTGKVRDGAYRDKTRADSLRVKPDTAPRPPRPPRDTLIDTLRVPGTPGSPTGRGAPGTPGAEPMPERER